MTTGFWMLVTVEAVGVIVFSIVATAIVLEDERNAKKQKEGQQKDGRK